MKYSLQRISGPDAEPLTVTDVKTALGEFQSVTDRDNEIEELIESARQWVEGETGRILIEQTLRLRVGTDRWIPTGGTSIETRSLELGAGGELWLRRSPVIEVIGVSTITAIGEESALGDGVFEVRDAGTRWPSLMLLSGGWPTADNAIAQVEFRAGFIDTSTTDREGEIPAIFKRAMKLHIEAHYNRDEKMMDKLIAAARDLLRGAGELEPAFA